MGGKSSRIVRELCARRALIPRNGGGRRSGLRGRFMLRCVVGGRRRGIHARHAGARGLVPSAAGCRVRAVGPCGFRKTGVTGLDRRDGIR